TGSQEGRRSLRRHQGLGCDDRHRLMRPILAALVAFFAIMAAAQAEETASCAQFAWPLDAEKAWFAAPDLRKGPNGETIPAVVDGAIEVQLVDLEAAKLPKPPERAPKPPDLDAGFVTFSSLPKAGLLQVTLTGEGWIDMIQADAYLPSKEHTGKRDCPG